MTFQNTVSVIARRTTFSTAHLYSQRAFTPEENAKVFGSCYSKHGHGHDYVLEVFVEGPIDAATGLVINVTDLDIVMKKVVAPFDFKHVNFDVPEFKDVVPTTENLGAYFHSRIEAELKNLGGELKLNRVKLFETEDLWTEVRSKSRSPSATAPSFEVTRRVEIRAMHHLENPSWSKNENLRVFGMCYGLHGHDYKVQVTCRGELDASSGFAIGRDELDDLLERVIVKPFDGVDLNRRFENTSCEAVAHEFFKLLEPHLKSRLVRVGIQETRKNYFEFPPAN
ncbi:MAG: 6-carboxytetrahydropterin synthase [Bdellovibrionota bacterium]